MNSAATERLEFAPPPVKGSLRALALALLVHLLLIAALTWGVDWKHSEEGASFEAELWSASGQAAPAEPAPTPPSPEPTPPAPVTAPPPVPPPVKAPEVKAAPTRPEADIALEKEKERQQAKKLQEKQLAEQALALRKAAEKAAQAEKAAEQKLQAKALEKEKLAAAEAAEKRHQEAVKRMIGMAGATAGSGSGSGSGASKGPSAGYSSKVIARILPNVVFTDDITGSPRAEVEVRSTADGTIMSQRLVKSSGNKAWDDAVLKAIVRTGSLPRDIDGSVPTPMIIGFQPGN